MSEGTQTHKDKHDIHSLISGYLLQTTELCSESLASTLGFNPSEIPILGRQTLFSKAIKDTVIRDVHLVEIPYLVG